MWRAGTSILVLFLLTAGCAQKRPHGAVDGVEPTDFQDGAISPSMVFPHLKTWKDAASHGGWVVQYGFKECLRCHEKDFCNSCHPLYPHADNWALKEIHGDEVIRWGKGNCASRCHGTDLKGGLSGVSCNACHSIYPHNAQWSDEHGATLLSLGQGACQSCHGLDLSATLGGKNCRSCHADYPHPDPAVWDHFTGGHGEKVNVTYSGKTTTCEACHGLDLKAMKNGKNCFSCHPSYPHSKVTTEDWKVYEGGHGEYALLHTKIECQLCHGTDYQGGSRGNPSCDTCHEKYPHSDDWSAGVNHGLYVNSKTSASCGGETGRCHGLLLIPTPGFTKGPDCTGCHKPYPHPSDWVSVLPPLTASLHGPVARADIDLCKPCHGSGLDYATSGRQTCKDCHPTLLRHKTAAIEGADSEHWGTWEGHGEYLSQKPDTTKWDAAECQLCHGADYQGGVSDVSCKKCHESYPVLHNLVDWKTTYDGHGKYVLEEKGGNKELCKLCHGTNEDPVTPFTGGHSGKSCYTCHTDYPHKLGWGTREEHGAKAVGGTAADRTGKYACSSANCHNTDFRGRPSLVPSCYGCHDDFPHEGFPDWMPPPLHDASAPSSNPDPHPTHVVRFVEKMKAGIDDACQECHGADYDRQVGGTKCSNCHAEITHRTTDLPWRNGAKHGDYFSQRCTSYNTKYVYPDASRWIDGVWVELYTPCDVRCFHCHGGAVDFHGDIGYPGGDPPDLSQTREVLSAQSDCYDCHWAYPHRSNSLWGRWRSPSYSGEGHVGYAAIHPLFTKKDLPRPPPDRAAYGSDDFRLAARNTCGGGSAGSCHNTAEVCPTAPDAHVCTVCHEMVRRGYSSSSCTSLFSEFGMTECPTGSGVWYSWCDFSMPGCTGCTP